MRHDPWKGCIDQRERAVHITPDHVGKSLPSILKGHLTKHFDYILEDLERIQKK
jgi:hypothetical protein